MDKSCANHPESMALATCKACEKSICLMCVVDEKEGTFCSSDCHTAFANGQEVPKFVAAAAPAAAAAPSGAQKIESIFDDEPASAPSAAPVEDLPAAPADDPMPIVAEGTKWRPIGAQCQNHTDTPAVANCDRCSKPVCALCLLEAAQGTFCSSDCMNAIAKQPAAQPAPAERAALQGRPQAVYRISKKSARGANKGVVVAASILFVLIAVAGGYYGWNGFAFHPDPRTTTTPDPVTDPGVAVTPTDPSPVDPPKDPVVKQPDPPPRNPTTDLTNPPPINYVPPRPRVKVVKPKAIQMKAVNPWADSEPGTWYRIRTQRGSQVGYTDTGLKEKSKDFYVLVTQTSSNGQDSPVSETRVNPPSMYLRGEESFTYEGQTFLCEIRTPSSEESGPKFWTLLEGKNRGAVFKSETPEGAFTAARVWEHTLKVKNVSLECLVVEGPVQNLYTKMWFCGSVPLGVIRKESDRESSALIDLGNDWSKRPAFPK
jgi:hypothetical protein